MIQISIKENSVETDFSYSDNPSLLIVFSQDLYGFLPRNALNFLKTARWSYCPYRQSMSSDVDGITERLSVNSYTNYIEYLKEKI